MAKYPPVAEVVDRIKESTEHRLSSVPRTLPVAIAKGDAELVHYNIRVGALSCLRAAMVYARYDKDFVTSKQYCARGADYADTLTDMARQGFEGTPWSGLYVLYCSLLAGRVDNAEKVSQWMSQCPEAAESTVDPHDPLAMLSGYAVLDLREKFEVYRRERFDKSWHVTHSFFGSLSIYIDLWHSVLKRDQATFDAVMLQREDYHVRLGKQKGEGRLEFGGGEDSKYIVDFMGIGCAIMARRRGMSCDIDTVYLPRAMVDVALN